MLFDKLKLAAIVLPGLALLCACNGGAPEDSGVPATVVRENTLGTAFLGQQEWEQAASAFRRGLEIRTDDPLLLSNLGVALLQAGNPDEAEAHLRAALNIDPDYPYAHYNLGLIETNRGNFEAAASHFEVVASFDPQDVLTQYNLGTAYASLGRAEDSIAALRRALEIDPDHVSSLYALGRQLVTQGEREEGRTLITRSQEVRARSGLDTAVGSNYGDQGPYALGVDYPGGALSAPAAIDISFAPVAEHGTSGAVATTLARAAPDGAPAVIVSDGASVGRLHPDSGYAELLGPPPGGGRVVALAAGDGDNDEIVELYALVGGAGRPAELAVVEQSAGGEFSWVDPVPVDGAAVLPEDVDAGALMLVDRDHDGDLDLLFCWAPSTGSSCALATNDGGGRLRVAASTDHGFDLELGDFGSVRLALTDFDNDRDIDFVVGETGGIHVLSNQRDGTFASVGADVGLGQAAAGLQDLAVADVDKDGWMDIVAGGKEGLRLYSNRRGRFGDAATLAGHDGSVATLTVFDADNDGFLDLVVADTAGRQAAYRNLGRGDWQAAPAWFEGVGEGAFADAVDADADGDLDLVIAASNGVSLLQNDGGNGQRWISVESQGVGDNRYGVGAKVEILAGALRQKFEVTNPMPVHMGLGDRGQVDSVRHLWPSGVLQDEVQQKAGGGVVVTQLDRKGTSCPILYVWRDGQWEFVTDFLGGSAIGYQKAPGVFSTPDTDEYIKLEPAPTVDGDGLIKLRVNNQLQEIIWFDQLELLVVDHPNGTEVFPNERLMPAPPWPEFRLFVSDELRPIVSARDVRGGQDWTETLAEADGQYVENFENLQFKGYAGMHTLELDLGPFAGEQRVVLLLDGWIDYADSTANVAASQAGLGLTPPVLTIADGEGGWLGTGHLMGFPAGLPKTMAVDLSGLFPTDDHRVRIETNMRIYWDRARLLVGGEQAPYRLHRLSPVTAELRHGGFPAEIGRGDRRPPRYDPSTVDVVSPWMAHVGRYTAFGDVTDLVRDIDDRMVTTRSGDEIEIGFRSPGPVPEGHTRTLLMFADGFGKDMDPNSDANDVVGPMPFHGMPTYPYPSDVVPPVDISDTLTRSVGPSERGWPGGLPQVLAPSVRNAPVRTSQAGRR